MKTTSSVSKVLNALSKIIPPVAGILLCIILILVFAANPNQALKSFFIGSFNSKYYFGNFLTSSGFLLLAGTGAAFSCKSGNMNLGGEGQIYLGGFVSCLILNYMKAPPAIVFTLALLSSIAGGALVACFSAMLKEKRGALPLLTTFLVSSALIPLIDGLIMASKSNSGTNMLSLPYIDQCYRMPHILEPSPLTISFFISIALAVGGWMLLYKTQLGKQMTIWGISTRFAEYSGFSSAASSYSSLAISGALHGLTGFFAVTGTYFSCHKDFYLGMGWNALSATLLSSSNPLLLIPFSLFLGWLYSSADRVSLTQGFGFDISSIIQGVILFSTAIPFVSKKIIHTKKESLKNE